MPTPKATYKDVLEEAVCTAEIPVGSSSEYALECITLKAVELYNGTVQPGIIRTGLIREYATYLGIETFHPGIDKPCDFTELIARRKRNMESLKGRSDGKMAEWAKPGVHNTII